MNSTKRKDLAEQTVRIAEQGHYTTASGRRVDIGAQVQACLEGTRLYQPEELLRLRHELPLPRQPAHATRIEVRNETTLQGAARLLAEGQGRVAALNFASARNPGGGFLRGTQAQEESLAYASALYRSLQRAWPYYERHRNARSLLYSDTMILSPECPVFRDDDGALLEQPRLVSFITSAAPNAGALRDNGSDEIAQLPEVFDRRVELVLSLAAAQGHTHLVLGAWGCGVFRNDPALVAELFCRHLGGAFAGCFERVVFSVLDRSAVPATFEAFRAAFAGA